MRDMEKNARDFVYLDTQNYASLEMIKKAYLACFFVSLIPLIVGIVIAKAFLFTLIVVLYNIICWIFIAVLQSKFVKKTFALRFLTNGILGLIISAAFGLCFAAVCLYSEDASFLGISFVCLTALSYILYIIIYSIIIIIGVHKGVYSKIKEKSQSPKFKLISSAAASLIPVSGLLGMNMSKMISRTVSENTSMIIGIFAFILLFFLIGLGHINFIQYYYCKKYKITCDENGDSTSPKLERKPKKSEIRKKKAEALQVYENVGSERSLKMSPDAAGESWAPEMTAAEEKILVKKKKRKIPVLVKIIIGIALAIAAFFVVLFIIGFIKAIIENI